mmetsp:Transcript_47696/g.153488  ORF Transcript_47696/g.153488 Transcript_47696/m.153488 type:complete len:341 (+) Transcript_47696:71-1093(+)
MELHVVSTEGVPEGCVLSVRAGTTRRQARIEDGRPFRFPTTAAEALPFKVDVLEPVASARFVLRAGDEKRTDCQYVIPLEAQAPSKDAVGTPKDQIVMSVTVAAAQAEEEGAEKGAAAPEGTKEIKRNSSSARLSQACTAREYLDRHRLVEFTQLLIESVIKEQPDKPYAFMARQFNFPEPQPRPGAAAKAAAAAAAATAAAAAAAEATAARAALAAGGAATLTLWTRTAELSSGEAAAATAAATPCAEAPGAEASAVKFIGRAEALAVPAALMEEATEAEATVGAVAAEDEVPATGSTLTPLCRICWTLEPCLRRLRSPKSLPGIGAVGQDTRAGPSPG